MTPPSVQRITAALDEWARQHEYKPGPTSTSGEWLKYRCPVHDDDNPSLGVIYNPDKQKAHVECFTGICTDEEILHEIGLTVGALFDKPRLPHPGGPRQPHRRPGSESRPRPDRPVASKREKLGRVTGRRYQAAIYSYTDADGRPLGEIVRVHIPHEHGIEKQFHQRHMDSGGRWWKGGFGPVLYHLPQVADAITEGVDIYLVEGEKDADRGLKAGLHTTCNAMGAGKFRPEHAHQLRGAARVIIVADKDFAGYKHAAKVRDLLAGRVGEVVVMEAATGKDLSDHFDAGHDIDELIPVSDEQLANGPAVTNFDPAMLRAAIDTAAQQTENATQPDGGALMGEISGLGMGEAAVSGGEVEHAAHELGRLLQALLGIAAAWANAGNARRKQEWEAAKREDEAKLAAWQARHDAERKAMHGMLADVEDDNWWKTAGPDELTEAFHAAKSWAQDDQVAERAYRALATGLMDKYGIDVEQLDRTGDPDGALEAMANRAFSDQAADERARVAQRYAVNAVAEIRYLDDDQRTSMYRAISEHVTASASILAAQRSEEQPEQGREARRDSARARLDLLLAEAPKADRDKVMFALDYLTGDPRADIGDADWGASSDTRAKVDEKLVEYQQLLRAGLDTTAVTEQLTQLVGDLSTKNRKEATDRGIAVRAAPGKDFEPLWPGEVHKDRLTDQMHELLELSNTAARDRSDADKRRIAELKGGLTKALGKNSVLVPIEQDHLKLVMNDAEQPGRSKRPAAAFADDESQYRQQRRNSFDTAWARAHTASGKVTELLQRAHVPVNIREKFAPILAEFTRTATQVAVNGDSSKKRLDALEEQRKRLGKEFRRWGVPAEAHHSIIAVTYDLEKKTLAAAVATRREHADRDRRRGRGRGWDTEVRIAEIVAELSELPGVSPEVLEALKSTEIASGAPPQVNATSGGTTRARKTSPGAGMDAQKRRELGR